MAIGQIKLGKCYEGISNKFIGKQAQWGTSVNFMTQTITLYNVDCGKILLRFNGILPASVSQFEKLIVKPLRELYENAFKEENSMDQILKTFDSRFTLSTPGERIQIEVGSDCNLVPATIMKEGLHDLLEVLDSLVQLNSYNKYISFVEETSNYDVYFLGCGFRITASNGGEVFFPVEWKQDMAHTFNDISARLNYFFSPKAWVVEQVEQNPDSDMEVSELFADAKEIKAACEEIASITNRFIEKNDF